MLLCSLKPKLTHFLMTIKGTQGSTEDFECIKHSCGKMDFDTPGSYVVEIIVIKYSGLAM